MIKKKGKLYYLHRKVKSFGADVYSRKRQIEIDAQLFSNPSPLMLTYLHKLKNLQYNVQLVIMKATKEKTDKPAKTTETAIAKQTTFITSEELIEKFVEVKKKIPELDKMSAELKVNDDATLVVATNNLSTIAGYIKEVENTRKILKDPYVSTGKMIDQYCKGIDDMLQRFKLRLGSEVTNYKTLKEAQERKAQQERLAELELLEKEKTEESELLLRIEKQIYARLYGGIYYTKQGERKSSAGCIKSDDCIALHELLNKSIPPISSFKHFPERYEEMIRKMAKRIAEHQTNLMDVEGPADFARTTALEKIAQAKTEAEVESIDNKESVEKQIVREIRKEEIKTEKAVESAGKGIRQDLKYKIIDELLVPKDFFSIDHKKVMDYLNANREKIKQDLIDNNETVQGIKFYVEGQYIAR